MVARIDSCHRGAVESRKACQIWQPPPAMLSMTSITVPRGDTQALLSVLMWAAWPTLQGQGQ
jgi:hypothetical protein